jgi:hypothetical protein
MDQLCEPSLFDKQRRGLRARVLAFPTRRPHEPLRENPEVVLSCCRSPKKEDTATLKRTRESSPKKSADEAVEKVVEVPEIEDDRVRFFDLGFSDYQDAKRRKLDPSPAESIQSDVRASPVSADTHNLVEKQDVEPLSIRNYPIISGWTQPFFQVRVSGYRSGFETMLTELTRKWLSNYRPFSTLIGGTHYIEPTHPGHSLGYRVTDDGTTQHYCVQCRLAGSGENFMENAGELVQHVKKCQKKPKSVQHHPVPAGFLCTPDEFPVAIEMTCSIRLIHEFKSTKGIDRIKTLDNVTAQALEDFVRDGLHDSERVTGWICRHCVQNGEPLKWGCVDGLSDHWLTCKYNSRKVQPKEGNEKVS